MNRLSSSMPGMNGRREIIWSHVRNGVMRICRRSAMRSKTATVSHPDDSIVLKVPKINSLDTSSPRPFWSVMIPVYNPPLPYLEQTLRCVLDQDAGAIFCRHAIANSNGHWIRISELHRESAGLLDDWHAKITAQQLIQCAAIAVRRSVYEQLGGLLPPLHYVTDSEMWHCIPPQITLCSEPSILG